MADVVRIEDAERVRTITFARPDQANAFDEALYGAVAGALAGAATDDGIGAVVLTGEGRTFCAGTDLVEMAAMVASMGASPEAADEAAGAPTGGAGTAGQGFVTLLDELSVFPKPLLAAVNGAGVGLGLTMLAHCDLVVMADTARLKAPFTAMGVPPEAASSYLLPRRMGRQAAALALFSSRWITAAEAVECGLALRQVPAEEVVAETVALAREIAALSLPSLLATKRLLLDAEAAGVARARQLEDAAFAQLLRGQGVEQAVLGQLDH